MTKQEAMQLLGVTRPTELARALKLSKQAIHSWADPLTEIQRDRVQAELWRREQAKPAEVGSSASLVG